MIPASIKDNIKALEFPLFNKIVTGAELNTGK